MGVDREDFFDAANWQTPRELPDLRRVGIVALDAETRDEGLRDKRGSSWPWRGGHVCGVSLAWHEGGEIRAIYIPMRHPDTDNSDPSQVYRWLKDLIASGVRRHKERSLRFRLARPRARRAGARDGRFQWRSRPDMGARQAPSKDEATSCQGVI
jgi:hypothetical protein